MIKIISLCVAILWLAAAGCAGQSAPDAANPAVQLTDALTDFNSAVWQKADGWSNGAPFLSGWCTENSTFTEEMLELLLDANACSNERYASGEYRTLSAYGYGRMEVEMRAASGSGIVSSFFVYTGASDGNPHDEIDVEILGMNTTQMQVNYFKAGVPHEQMVDLGFDAAADFHHYVIEWRENAIRWYVDGTMVFEALGTAETLPTTPGRIMMNIWACDAVNWCGQFDDTVLPVRSKYRNFRYTSYE